MTRSRSKWVDPFDEMSDEELDAHVEELFAARPRTVGVSLRMPVELLDRVKREAARRDVPYQTFVKAVLEGTVSRLERRTGDGPRPPRRSATRRRTAARAGARG